MATEALDPKKLKEMSRTVFDFKRGQMVSILIHLADRLDLPKTMAKHNQDFHTTDELSKITGYHRRWLMELLRGLAAAKVLEYQEGTDVTEKFRIGPEGVAVLANEEDSLVFAAGAFANHLVPQELSDGLVKAFTTGIGMSYRAMSIATGGSGALGTKRALGAFTRLTLVPKILPSLLGGKLVSQVFSKPDARILDCGCGAGIAANEMAKAFPNVAVEGLDPDITALGIARKDAEAMGNKNATFTEGPGEGLTKENYYDFAVTLDIIHDTCFPDKILAAIFRALKPGGTIMVKDIKSTGSFPTDMKKIPFLPMMYGFSVST